MTHRHPEGVAGAVAVALAAAFAASRGTPAGLLEAVLDRLPPSDVRDGIGRAARIAPGADPRAAAAEVGNGASALAVDTVPFALWAAAAHLEDYPAALEACVLAGGDVDSLCAIAGGIVAARVGAAGIPREWIDSREPLPDWFDSPR